MPAPSIWALTDPTALEVVPLTPAVTLQSLQSGDLGAGTTAASSDIVLAKDPDNYTKVCDGKMAGANIIAPWIVTKTFWDDDPKAAAAFVEAAFRANEYINSTDPAKVVEHVLAYYARTRASMATPRKPPMPCRCAIGSRWTRRLTM